MDLHVEKRAQADVNSQNSSEVISPYVQAHIDAMFRQVTLPYQLYPGERILMSTTEVVTIGEGWCGLICLRSTWARLGLLSPPTVADPGFNGSLTMELYNGSQWVIELKEGDAIWSMTQLLIKSGSQEIYQGRYQGQQGVTIPKALRSD